MKSRNLRITATVLAMSVVVACSSDSTEDENSEPDYPSGTVTWIVPFAAGGGADAAFRVFQKYAEELVDVSIPVVNVEGAGGVTGWTQFLNSDPDGYTLSLATPPFNIIPAVIQPDETPYELDQFQYICSYASSPNALFIQTGETRFTTLEEVIAHAEANPGQLTAGTTGASGTDTIHLHQLQLAADIELVPVPFESGADAAQALSSGQVDLVFSDTSWIELSSGEMTAVAVSSENPHPSFPDIPTYVSAGYEVIGARMRAPAAPQDTPAHVIEFWEDICRQVTENEDFAAELAAIGQPLEFLTAEEATDFIRGMEDDIRTIAEAADLGS